MPDLLAIIRGAHQKGPRRTQVLEASRSQVLGVWEEADGTGVALHHALIEYSGKGKILRPDAHVHHEIKIG